MESVDARIASAPLPTPATVRRRRSLPVQVWWFALINARTMRMVRKGHH